MDVIKILNTIDRRVIYILISIAVIIPLLLELEMEIIPDPYAKAAHKAITEEFKDSSNKRILLSFDYGPSTGTEVNPMAYAIMKQVLSTGNEVHMMALFDQGLQMLKNTQMRVDPDGAYAKQNKIFILGYAPGAEAVIKGMLSDIRAIFPKSNINDSVQNLCDYDFIVSFSSGTPGSKEWVMFGGDPSKQECGKDISVSTGVTAVQAPELIPYVGTGQLKGMLAGLGGAASYESLMEDIGSASEKMPAQSSAHVLIIILIIIGNVTYFVINEKKVKHNND